MFNRRGLRRTKTLSLVIILSLQLNSVVQAATIAQPDCSQGKNPEVMKAANQTTVVNIRRPNAQGLSHNQYIDLQVDRDGLIFNNSSEISKTQLAGFITGNKQLAGGKSANVILNEVTGNMPTNLNGYMEIAGNKASLVLANPNGLVGNNFGFINTNRAVLTTGIPYTDPLGKLDGFSVSGGSIAIEGAGLNAKETAYTDIYARAVKLNAGIWADNLNVIIGSNKISYETGRIQEILDKKDQGISLDVAALGGMYAHRIALVGTAQGLGVNTVGTILADKLSVDQEGHVINSGKILSKEELNLKTKADLLNQGELQSNGTVAIESGQGLTNLGKLQSNESMHIVAAKDFTNTGTIGSGTRLSVNALHFVNDKNGQMVVEGLRVKVGREVNNKGKLVSGKDVYLSGTNLINAGDILGQENVTLVDTTGFANSKTIASGKELKVASQGKVHNTGNLHSGAAMNITCHADLTNLGQINSTGTITINSQKAVYNKKLISGTTGIIITSTQDLVNEDVMQSQGDMSLSSGANLRNEKLINGGKTTIAANGILHNAQGGRIYGDDITIKAKTINNITEGKAPVIASRENLHLEADTINNHEHALLLSAGDMDIKAGTLNNNSATIEAGKDMHIHANLLYNTNEHFAAEMRTVQDEQLVEYQGSGSPHRYSAKGSGYTFDDKTVWPNKHRPNFDVYLFNDESLYLHTPEGDHEEWIKYEFRRVIKQPVITASDPGKITSGGSLTLTGDKVINDKSQIIAGGALTAKVNELQNIEETGKQYVEDVGLVHNYWRHERRGRDSTGHKQKDYKPVVAITDIQVQAGSYLGNTVATGSGVTAENKIDTDNGKQIGNIEDIGKGTTINVKPSSLFDVIDNPTAAYYVETDPAFTNMQNWLSSDYFFKHINYDANKLAKRLGDGYYEQKIVRDQLMSLTGQRRVGDYASDEAQYKALLDNAVAFAKQSDAQVGVALTTQQQKELKNTLVWMVEKSVVLPNGEVVKALVPQVYVPQEKTAYGIRSTAVLAGRSIDVAVANDILNNGTIVATRGAAISAQNINNYSGKIQGSDILLKAQKDLNNVGGTLLAENSLTAQAGRDINMATTNTTSADVTGSKRTALNQIGGAYVTGDKGQMKLEAGRDLNLQAAEIVTEGKDSKAALNAGRDVNLSTTEVGSANTIAWDNKNYRKDASSQDIGTSVQAGGDLDIKAGRDFSAMGAYVAAEQKLKVETGKNINIGAGRHKEQVEEHHVHKGKSGGGNSLTKTTDERLDGNYALGSTITGGKVSLQAGNDVSVTGSNVVGTNDVNIKAKGNVHITPVEESQKEKHFSKVEAKGIFGSGFGFVIGKQTTTEKQDVQSKMQAGSTVGSVTGNVNIAAGQNLQVEGSKVVAGKDINMSGAKVDVQAAEETYDSQYRYDYSLKGLSVSLGGGIVDRGQKVLKSLERAHQAEDKRLSALYSVKAYQDAKNLTKDHKFNVNVGVSNYQEKETSDTSINTAKGSIVQAGGDVQIKAIEQDINIVGSGISGNKVSLEAAQKININAVGDSYTNQTDDSNTSVGIGISLSPTSGPGVYVSSGKCTENQNTTKTTHNPSTVIARDKLTIKSGRDTNIIGSQVQGDRVEAQVGGNLNLESQQDTETYKEKSAQASVDIGVGTTTVGASGGKMTSDYSSVTGQAGIYAGKAGFDITVKGNTDLKGAVIDSKVSSENKLTTGTITYSDIKNEAEYDAKGVGLSYDSVATNDENEKLGNKGVIPAIPMGAGEKGSSTTRSAVAPGTIEIRDKDKQKQDIAGLSRDTDNTLNKLDPIFDKDKVRERQELAGLFSELAFKQIHDMKNCSDEQRAILHSAVGLVSAALVKTNLSANALVAGANELVVQTLMNKVKVKVNGVEQPYFAIYPDQLQWLSGILGGLVSGAVGGNVGAGASTAASGTKNNMLSLTQLEAYLKELNDKAISRNSSGAILDTYGSYKATNDEQQIDLIEAMKDPDYCARLDKALEENLDLTEFEGIVVYGKDINSKEFIDARIPENRQAIIDRETILCDEIAKNIVTSIPVGGEAYLKQKAVNANNVKSLSSTPMFQALRKAGMAVDVIVFGGTIYTDLTTYDDWRDKTIAVVCDASAIGFSRAGGMAAGAIAGALTYNPMAVAICTYSGYVAGGIEGNYLANIFKEKLIK